VCRNAESLRRLPVWLVSSGPIDDSATQRDIGPTSQARKLIERVGARGHITLGGRLTPEAKGFPARATAKTKAGDWRDEAHVRDWVASIVEQLRADAARSQPA
jgi:menaquinone-dependent protoporphyrinogen oxidase